MATLIIIEPQATISELLAQYSVLFSQILDHIHLALIHPTGQHYHDKLKRIEGFLHRLVIVSSQFKTQRPHSLIRVFGPYGIRTTASKALSPGFRALRQRSKGEGQFVIDHGSEIHFPRR